MRKKSLIRKFLIYIIITILLSNLILFIVNYTVMNRAMVKSAVTSGKNMLKANMEVVDHYFQDIDHIADAIIYNETLIGVLKSYNDTNQNMDFLRSVERLYYHSRDDLQLTFYKACAPNNAYSIYTTEYYKKIGDYTASKWYRMLEETNEDRIILTNVYSNYSENPDSSFVHSAIYRIYDLYSDNIVGYLRIDMDLEQLRSKLLLNYTDIEGVEILSEDNELLFYTSAPFEIPEKLFKKSVNNAGELSYYEGQDYFLTYGISPKTGWKLILSMSKSSMLKESGYILAVYTVALFSVLIITMLLCLKFSNIISKNIKRLMKGMADVKKGNLKVQIESNADDEIGQLIKEFNDMVGQINELVYKVEKNQRLLNEAEMKALQQQINPHFIYNTMETLMGLASEGMDAEIIEISKCMSAMFRYNTKLERISTIAEEIQQVKNYIMVQQLRMDGRFKTRFDIDKICMDGKIVKLALQPIVENAISHGLANISRGGILALSINKVEDKVEIMVMDNGSGIRPEKLRLLQEQICGLDEDPLQLMEQNKDTGLLNVHLRLKLLFREEYHMEIESVMCEETKIRIYIPFWKKGE